MAYDDDTGGIAARLDEQASYYKKLLRTLQDWRAAISRRNLERLSLLAEKLTAEGTDYSIDQLLGLGGGVASALLEQYGVEPLTDPATVDQELDDQDIEPFFRVYREMELAFEASTAYAREKLRQDVAAKNLTLLESLHEALTEQGWSVRLEAMLEWSASYTNLLLKGNGLGTLVSVQTIAGILVPIRDGRIIKSRQRPEWN